MQGSIPGVRPDAERWRRIGSQERESWHGRGAAIMLGRSDSPGLLPDRAGNWPGIRNAEGHESKTIRMPVTQGATRAPARNGERRRLDIGFAVAVGVLVLVAVASALSMRGLLATESAIRRTDQELILLSTVLSNLQDAQLGQRGYLLAGEESRLAPYREARARLGSNLDALEALAADAGSARIARLRTLSDEQLTLLEATIEVARAGELDSAVAIVRRGAGERRMQELRALTAAMSAGRVAENSRLRGVAARRAAWTTLIVVLGSGLAIGIVLLSRSRIGRELRSREAAEQRLARNESSLRSLYQVTSVHDAPFDEKLRRVLELGRERFGLETGVVARITGDHYEVVQAVSSGLDVQPGDVHELQDTYCASVVHADAPIAVEHAAHSDFAGRTCYTKFDQETYIGTPVRVDGAPYGTLCFLDRDPRATPFSESDRDFLQLMSQWVGTELERARAEEAIRQRERRYRVLVESANDLIYVTDNTGRLTYVNPTAVRTTGYSADELLGMYYLELVRSDARAQVQAHYEGGADGATPPYFELPIVTREGREIWLGQNVELLREEDRITGVQVVARDITKQVEVEGMKDEFLSVVSHELRTPLTAIRGSLGLLASGKLGTLAERGQRMLEIAALNTDRLVRLINDLLDIEKIESGRVTLDRRAADAAALVQEAVDVMRPMAESHGVVIESDCEDARLWVDPDRVQQVLTNLLSNAIKFSPAGGVVTVETVTGSDDVEFRVRDRGRGIPADKLETVFERFQQVDSSDSREKGGTGLGLPIARSIVQQHGGSIRIESRWGAGSTIVFTLPRMPAPIESDHGATSCDVLIVEDDESVSHVLAEALSARGITTRLAFTGEEALELSGSLSYRLLVLDPGLPGMDGFAVVQSLRNDPRLRDMPTLVYTSRDLTEADEARLRLGPTEYMTKSRDPIERVQNRVLELLERSGSESEGGSR
jgi:PAS domain S-box-containing protein